jgi:hypothetical protein
MIYEEIKMIEYVADLKEQKIPHEVPGRSPRSNWWVSPAERMQSPYRGDLYEAPAIG